MQTIKFSICASVRKKLLFNSVFIFLQQERDTSDDGVTSGRFVGLFITTHTRADHILYVSFLFYHFQNPVGQPLTEQQVNWVLKQHILCVSAATERSH